MVLSALAAFGYGRKPGDMRDFEVYWTAAARASEAQPLYRADDGHYQFKYLPAFAVLSAPVAGIPLETAKRVWFVASVALLCTLLSLSVRILPAQHKPTPLLVAAMVVVMGKFFGHELVLGQVNLLFAALAAGGILMLTTREVTAATLLFVLAVVVKPYAVIFLPWLVYLHGRRVLLPLGLGALAVAAVPWPLYGLDGTLTLHHEWWQTVTASTAPNLTNADNVSLAGLFAKWLGTGTLARTLAAITSAGCLGMAAAAIWRGRGLHHREALEGSLLLILIPLLSPQGWDYVFLIATPAAALLVNYTRELPLTVRIVSLAAMLTIGLSLFDLMGRQRYAVFMEWSVITVCFIVLVAALVVLRSRRVA